MFFFGQLGRSRARRRGVVLILILGMLALMALIGVTFATFAGQSLVNTRNFAAGVNSPGSEQLMDYALAQLINDTNNPLSAIRGHSLLRDMYGNDSVMGRRYDQFQAGGTPLAVGSAASINCFLTALPNGAPLVMTFQQVSPVANWKPFDLYNSASPPTYGPQAVFIQYATNIPTAASNPAFYGLDFTRWIVRVPGTGGAAAPNNGTVNATYEVVEDDYSNSVVAGVHVLTLAPLDPTDSMGLLATRVYNNPQTPNYNNNVPPTPNPGVINLAQPPASGGGAQQFFLDGRYMRAFNGPGMNAFNLTGWDSTATPPYAGNNGEGHPYNNAGYGNFRLNGNLLQLANGINGNNFTPSSPPAVPGPAFGDPNAFGMDEDYDACDLENWFLALQSADGSVMIPSFHRPGILVNNSATGVTDWTSNSVMSRSKILRPRAADNYAASFPPDPSVPDSTGRLTYDVDNDGDGITDSVWLDLGYPVLRDPRGQSYKPLFAFMVLGLNGRLPLNTAGNLQSRDFQRVTSSATAAPGAGTPNPYGLPTPQPFQFDYYPQNYLDGPTWSHASHLGYSVNEVNPMFALQNAPNLVYGKNANGAFTYGTSSLYTQFDVATIGLVGDTTANGGVGNPQNSRVLGSAPYLYSGDTGNGVVALGAGVNPGIGIDVVQHRNLLSGTIPADNLTNSSLANQDSNFYLVGTQKYFVPDSMYEATDSASGTALRRGIAPVAGRWGEPNAIPTVLDNNGGGAPGNGDGMPVVKATTPPAQPGNAAITSIYPVWDNPIRSGKSAYSFNANLTNFTWLPLGAGDAADDDFDSTDFLPAGTVASIAANTNGVGSAAEGSTLYNAGPPVTVASSSGDVYDGGVGMVLPVERIRRFFNPIDAMGVGRVVGWNDPPPRNVYDYGNGFDSKGRVMFFRHFRPAGAPKSPSYANSGLPNNYQLTNATTMKDQLTEIELLKQPIMVGPWPDSTPTVNNAPNPSPSWDPARDPTTGLMTAGTNPYHGFMSALAPIVGISIGSNNNNNGDAMVAVASAMPYDRLYTAANTTYGPPTGYAYASYNTPAAGFTIPTYPFISTTDPQNPNQDFTSPATMSPGVNSGQGPVLVAPNATVATGGNNAVAPAADGTGNNITPLSLGGVATVVNGYPSYPSVRGGTPMPSASLNKDEADEMVPPQYGATPFDMPYGPADLEWLYRLQDVDGAQLTSRLGSLAPVSFLNPQDGLTRRRMFSVDVHDTIAPAFAPDNQPPLAYDFANSAASGGNVYNDQSFVYNSRFTTGASASLAAINYISGASSPNFQNSNAITLYPNPVSYPPSQGMIQGPAYNTGNGITYTAQQNPNSNAFQLPPIVEGAVASRNRKINLNYPLPVSNDTAEPVRQKWIRETYQYFKAVLPPQALDTPQELAQLSQFVVNIIDFRDPDCSATRFVNTDLMVVPATATAHSTLMFADRPVPTSTNFQHYAYDPTIYDEQMRAYQPQAGKPLTPDPNNLVGLETDWSNAMTIAAGPPAVIGEFLVQHGMEYSPLALNEVLAYQYTPAAGAGFARLAVEVANTLTDDATAAPPVGAGTTDNSESDFTTGMLDGWDFIVTNDGFGYSRPDPITGELPLPGLLNVANAYPTSNAVSMFNQPPTTLQAIISTQVNNNPVPAWPTNLFALQAQVNGNPKAKVINGLRNDPSQNDVQVGNNNGTAGGSYFQFGWTPNGAVAPAAENPVFPTNDATFPNTFGLPATNGFAVGQVIWCWVYLRRPANPFDTRPYAYREMVTVDSIRFPFTYGGVVAGSNPQAAASVYSVQRLQPFRGGHLVPPLPGNDGKGTGANNPTPATCWGFSEQTANGGYPSNPAGQAASTGMLLPIQGLPNNVIVRATHTFAITNNANQLNGFTTNGTNTATDNDWDYFVFNDRDFVSVAELMLVPGCPPGLFTKQFVENNNPWDAGGPGNDTAGANSNLQPVQAGAKNGYATSTPVAAQTQSMQDARAFPKNESQTYPYLIDKFFYSAASVAPPIAANNPNNLPYPTLVGNWTGDGWHKLLEFVEVPSSANGAIGTVATGDNFDWLRQDVKPGQINLNLIIDEEVFFGLMDDLRLNDLLNVSYATPTVSLPQVVTQIDQFGYPVIDLSGATRNGHHNISDVVTNDPGQANVAAVGAIALNVPHVLFTNGSGPNGFGKTGRGYTRFDSYGFESHGIKAAFADFLKLRAGGSGFLFAWGSGVTGSGPAVSANLPTWLANLPTPQPGLTIANGQVIGTPVARERPFRSLSSPDINDTIMRPATLPPSNLTFPGNAQMTTALQNANNTTLVLYTVLPPYEFFDPTGNPAFLGTPVSGATLPATTPPITVQPNNPTAPTNVNPPTNQQTMFAMDPGIRNPFMIQPSLTNTGNPINDYRNYSKIPPLIPVRRLLEVPDNSNGNNAPTIDARHISGAAEYLFNPANDAVVANAVTAPYNYLPNQPIYHEQLWAYNIPNNVPNTLAGGTSNLFLQQRSIQPPGAPTFPTSVLPYQQQTVNQYLGAALTGGDNDNRQHPYYRTELLQKLMNLTTVRTHQFAVWITIGFFEVLQQGSAVLGNPDFLGGEIGLAGGTNVRYRSFFILDRTRATGFDPFEPGDFRDVVTYRRRIE